MMNYCVGFAWQDFGSGGVYRADFCEKLPETFPMQNRANASWLQGMPDAGQD